jgi:hypothetical protein
MSIRSLSIVVFAVVACGPKVNPVKPAEVQPVGPLPAGATDKPPGTPTGTVVHLQCNGLNQTPCQTPDYAFDANYDHSDGCRWGGDNALSFRMKSTTSPSSALLLNIAGFNGAATYQLTGDNYLSLSTSVTTPAAGQCAGNTKTSALHSPKNTCTGCTAVVTDADPAAPYPKTLGISIACPNMCEENGWKCTPSINIQLSQTCTR